MPISCFSFLSTGLWPATRHKQIIDPQPDNQSRIPGCAFCDVSQEKGFNVVSEDDDFVVFRDRNPAAKHHLLVIPKRHVESVKTLKPDDASMIARMAEIGHGVLDGLDVPPNSRRLGFHIPPFNSVSHLHLHVQGLPYNSVWRRAKYPYRPGSSGKEKGLGWFVEVEQTIRILEKGGTVRILPC